MNPSAPPPQPQPAAGPDPYAFPDRLSPMVVKELRQGLRSRGFLVSFLLLQGLLVIAVLIAAAAASGDGTSDAGQATTAAFWGMVGLPLLLFLPLGGLSAVRREMDQKTLDLVLLTRLSAWRIILGKWIGLVLLAVLLTLSVLPYAALRYFLGGVELAGELTALGLVLAGCALLCGLTVSLSPYLSRVGRVIFLGLSVIGAPQLLAMIAFSLAFSRMGGGPFGPSGFNPTLLQILFIATFAILLLFLAFEYGAAKIAPQGENHAARQRILLALLVLAAAGIAPDQATRFAQLLAVAGIVIAASVFPMLEPIPTALAAYHPWVRSGRLRHLLGRFLYPGWPSAVLWGVPLIAALLAALAVTSPSTELRAMVLIVAIGSAAFFPTLVIRLLPIRRREWLLLILAHILMAVLALFVGIAKEAWKRDLTPLTLPLPTTQSITLVTELIKDRQLPLHLIAATVTGCIGAGGLLLLALIALRRTIRPLEQAAARTRLPES